MPTTRFEIGDILLVPFPHVERAVVVMRPGLLISDPARGRLLWILMITNAAREAWDGDVVIPKAETVGLLIPSKVRTEKITSVEAGSVRRLGRLDAATMGEVRRAITSRLGHPV